MLRRLPLLTLLAALLLGVSPTPGAEATPSRPTPTTSPLVLAGYAVTPEVPYDPAPPLCDGANFLACGYLAVQLSLAGLDGRGPRPALGDLNQAILPDGHARVVRSYGCQRPDGRRLHRFDRRVRETVRLNSRRGTPLFVPATGDVFSFQVYAFLLDAQPHNCPAGTQAMMYRLEARRVEVSIDSRWSGVPDASYDLSGTAAWSGAVPTPPAGDPVAAARH